MPRTKTPTTASSDLLDDSLAFVFSRAGTALLSQEEERAFAHSMWASRRRLEILLSRGRRPGLDGSPLPEVTAHRRPLTREVVRGLLAAERDARQRVDDARGSRRFLEATATELRAIDDAKNALVRGNLRLVAWVAKKFLGRGLDLADLFQEGSISLLEAVDRFDPARGTRLSTYATRAIQLGMVRALADKARTIRIPLHRLREVIDAGKAWRALRSKLEREPTEQEVASLSGVGESQLAELAPALRPPQSTDEPIPGTELSLGDVLADDGPSPFERVASSEAFHRAHEALERLPPRERRIVTLRYGIGSTDAKSFEAIGRLVGLSRERSRQLERSALRKLRGALESRDGYLERKAS